MAWKPWVFLHLFVYPKDVSHYTSSARTALLPVLFRVQFKFIMIIFKAINGQGPIYLQELVESQQYGAYNLRSINKSLMLQVYQIP